MKKKFGEEIKSVEIDPITGDYHLVIPEWIINEVSWYEETQIKFTIEGNEIILREYKDE
jgi:hypothetical protein